MGECSGEMVADNSVGDSRAYLFSGGRALGIYEQ